MNRLLAKSHRRIAAATVVMAAALLAPPGAAAYVRNEVRAGVPFFRNDANRIVYFVSQSTAAGMRNRSGEFIITPDSSPSAAIASALASWSEISGSAVRFDPPRPDSAESTGPDGRHLITFADTDSNRSIVGGALAATRLFANPNGTLTDTDIIFSPEIRFSTTLEPGAFDIEGILAHELGHALGLDHSGLPPATMFAFARPAHGRARLLTEDDAAFARAIYPSPDAPPGGSLAFRIFDESNTPVHGAHVAAFDAGRNLLVGGISERDGVATLAGLPPGEYSVFVEPLNGPAEPSHLSSRRRGVQNQFQAVVIGGAGNPSRFVTGVSAEPLASVTLRRITPALNIRGVGAAPPGEPLPTRLGAAIERGRVYRVELHGEGLDLPDVGLESIRILGQGVRILTEPLARGTLRFTDGSTYPLVRFFAEVSGDAPAGLVSVAIEAAGELAVFSGAIEVTEGAQAAPAFSSADVVNAASFASGPVAPGAIVSIFGRHLGPAEGVNGVFDPVSGRLSGQLAGVSVLVNGVPAPLFFVSESQINLQIPADAAVSGAVAVEILREGLGSGAESVQVQAAAPALFRFPQSADTIALRQDGTVNSGANPADRGEVIALFGTGQGATEPPVATGAPAPSSPFALSVGGVSALIDGHPAEVFFAGLAPGFVGLLQVNVRIPAAARSGAVPVRISVDGPVSPPGAVVHVR